MKLSELLRSDPSIESELPAALERALSGPVGPQEYATRRPHYRQFEVEGLITFDGNTDLSGPNPYNTHTNAVAEEVTRFKGQRGLLILCRIDGLGQRDVLTWNWRVGCTGYRPMDIETIAASRHTIGAFLNLANSGTINVSWFNEALV